MLKTTPAEMKSKHTSIKSTESNRTKVHPTQTCQKGLNLMGISQRQRSTKSRKESCRGLQMKSLLKKLRIPDASKTKSSCNFTFITPPISENTFCSQRSPHAISQDPNGTSLSKESLPTLTQFTAQYTTSEHPKKTKDGLEMERSSLDTVSLSKRLKTMDNRQLPPTYTGRLSTLPGLAKKGNGQGIISTLTDSSLQSPQYSTPVLSSMKKLSEQELEQGQKCYSLTEGPSMTCEMPFLMSVGSSIVEQTEREVTDQLSIDPDPAQRVQHDQSADGGTCQRGVPLIVTHVSGGMFANSAEETIPKQVALKRSRTEVLKENIPKYL